MAKLAASEAATAIAHQVSPSIDISDTQHAERAILLSQNGCLGKVGCNLLDYLKKPNHHQPASAIGVGLFSTATLLDFWGGGVCAGIYAGLWQLYD